ncbi:MAG: hypothetical protein VX335_04430 [Pseudomonadota bacterium]|nr:hypothetical protein [Pseudomonadota bacterium]
MKEESEVKLEIPEIYRLLDRYINSGDKSEKEAYQAVIKVIESKPDEEKNNILSSKKLVYDFLLHSHEFCEDPAWKTAIEKLSMAQVKGDDRIEGLFNVVMEKLRENPNTPLNNAEKAIIKTTNEINLTSPQKNTKELSEIELILFIDKLIASPSSYMSIEDKLFLLLANSDKKSLAEILGFELSNDTKNWPSELLYHNINLLKKHKDNNEYQELLNSYNEVAKKIRKQQSLSMKNLLGIAFVVVGISVVVALIASNPGTLLLSLGIFMSCVLTSLGATLYINSPKAQLSNEIIGKITKDFANSRDKELKHKTNTSNKVAQKSSAASSLHLNNTTGHQKTYPRVNGLFVMTGGTEHDPDTEVELYKIKYLKSLIESNDNFLIKNESYDKIEKEICDKATELFSAKQQQDHDAVDLKQEITKNFTETLDLLIKKNSSNKTLKGMLKNIKSNHHTTSGDQYYRLLALAIIANQESNETDKEKLLAKINTVTRGIKDCTLSVRPITRI